MNVGTATWLARAGLMIGLVLMTSCQRLPTATAELTDEPHTKAQPATPVNASPLVSPVATLTPRSERTTPATPSVEMPPRERQPPYDEPRVPPHPAEMARLDLARRLRADVDLIRVTQMETRELDTDLMPCLDRDWTAKEPGTEPDTVQWISLSYKGKTYHYVSLREFVIYCE